MISRFDPSHSTILQGWHGLTDVRPDSYRVGTKGLPPKWRHVCDSGIRLSAQPAIIDRDDIFQCRQTRPRRCDQHGHVVGRMLVREHFLVPTSRRGHETAAGPPPHCKAPWSASSLIEQLAARCQRLLAGGKSYDSAVQRLDKTTPTVSRTKSRKLASQTRSSGRRRMRNASFRFTRDEFSRSRRHSETYVAHVGSHQCHQELRSFSRRSLRLRRWSCQFKYCKEAFCFIERQKIVVDNNRLRCFKTTSRTTNAGTSR